MGEILEVGSRKHQRQRKHLTWVGQNARRCTEEKYDFKMRHLKRKHITELRNENKKDYVTKWREKHHNLQIYRELDEKEPEVIPLGRGTADRPLSSQQKRKDLSQVLP